MIRFRDRNTRGRYLGGMVEGFHSFSFGGYQDPAHMGFRSLRVINEDTVIPGGGIPTHAHEDMEILTFVNEGTIEHRDSLGNIARIAAGDVQRMTAGTGVSHSEMNPDPEQRARVLQVWIIPDRSALAPGYEQRRFPPSEHRNRLLLVASPDGRDGSLTVHQDAFVHVARLDEGQAVQHPLASGRGGWVQIVRGIVALNGTEMREGDGAASEDEESLLLQAETDCEAVLFDLA